MKKNLLLLLVIGLGLFFTSNINTQTTIEGDYFVGETKAKIKIENDEFRVFWDSVKGSTKLAYEENMINGEQVWIETKSGRRVGNFILNNDYTEGKYVRIKDRKEFFCKEDKVKRNKTGFRLMVITGRESAGGNSEKIIKKSLSAGVKAIHLREKDLSSNELLALAKKIKQETKKYNARLLINDRLDIALLSGAGGVHSPEKGIDAGHIKKYGKNLIAGKSVHSVKQAAGAEKAGFDYLLFGPVFRTPQKIKYGSPQGLQGLKKVCSSARIPVFAVGGITPARVKKCITAGAYGVAVIGAVMKSNNIKKTISEFKAELGEL